jgi:hypothetical protein
MKRFAMALVLMYALSTSILAGEMPTGGKTEPPQPPPTSSTSSTSSTLLANVVLTIITLIR